MHNSQLHAHSECSYTGNDPRTVYQDVKLFHSGKWRNIKWGHVCAFEIVQKSYTDRREFLFLYFEISLGTRVFCVPRMSTPGVPKMGTPGVP